MHMLVIFVQQSKINKFCINSTVFPTHDYCAPIRTLKKNNLAVLFIDKKN